MWSWHVHDFLTGTRLADVSPTSGSWQDGISMVGQASVTFQERGGTVNYAALFDGHERGSRVLVCCWNQGGIQHVKYAGMIFGTEWDVTAGTLQVRAYSIRAIFAKRTTFGSDGYTGHLHNNYFHLNQRSAFSIVSALVWVAGEGPVEGRYDLPINRGTMFDPGSWSRSYYDYHGTAVEEAFQDLEKSGMEIWFQAKLVGTRLEWDLQAGTRIGGTTVDFDMVPGGSTLSKLTRTRDGSGVANRVYALGKGATTRRKWAQATTNGNPIGLDAVDTSVNEDQDDALGQHASGLLAQRRSIQEQWSMSMIATGIPSAGQVRPGSTVRVNLERGRLESGWKNFRVLAISGGVGSQEMTLGVEAA